MFPTHSFRTLILFVSSLALFSCTQDLDSPTESFGAEGGDDFRGREGAPAGEAWSFLECDGQDDCPYANSICFDFDGPGFCTVPCTSSSTCPGDGSQICLDDVCIPTCTENGHCPNGYDCEGTTCVATPAGTDEDPIGDGPLVRPTDFTNFAAPCSINADCVNADIDPSVVCLTAISGGYCTIGCSSNSQCGSTAFCELEPAPGQLYCGLSCNGDGDCGRPLDLGCDLGLTEPVCTDLDLIAPNVDGPIDDPVTPGDGLTGDACRLDANCRIGTLSDNRCFTRDQGWPGGYCAAFGCFSDLDCGVEGFCARGTGPDAIGLCVKTCTATCDRAGYGCFDGGAGFPGLCLPNDLPDPVLDPPNVGNPCAITDQCTMGNGMTMSPSPVCIPPKWPDGEEGFPNGYCSAVDCTPNGADCGISAICVTLPADPADPASVDLNLCLEECLAPGSVSTCRTGYECVDVGDSMGVCWVTE